MNLSSFFKKTATAAMALLCISGSAVSAEDILKIHYSRPDMAYDNLGIWLWDHVKNPSRDWPTGATKVAGKDSFGAYFEVELNSKPSQVSFLILNTKDGNKLEDNRTVYLTGSRDVYLRANDRNIYDSPDLTFTATMKKAMIVGEDTIRVTFNVKDGLDAQKLAKEINITDSDKKPVEIESVTVLEGYDIEIKTARKITDKLPLVLNYGVRTLASALDWRFIDEVYAYDGDDLGCNIVNGEAVIKLWAPLAEEVSVCFYSKDSQNTFITKKTMNREDRGVWSIKVGLEDMAGKADSLRGCYYQYEIKNPGRDVVTALDPYAKSMAPVTVNPNASDGGESDDLMGKAAIVDINDIKPAVTKADIKGYNRREDAIIYEVHVRDFTSDPRITKNLTGRFGSFKAFIGRLPYLKKLGVTHVQLLPVMAWLYGDEYKMGEPEYTYKARNCNYNWGYDPQNYFSPDGAYSENPEDAELRIAELRELINAIHEAGMGVILDVVYTHMANATFLNNIVPDYYFFKDQNGNFVGDFGNNLATNRKMALKLMTDSVKHWFREYGIDGMRWDMMGDATADAVQACYDAAKEINPKAIFIGEGWRTFKGNQEDAALAGKGADQDWMCKTMDVGSFSDEMRNEMKSGFGSEGEPRFLTGGARNIKLIFNNIKGQPSNFKTSSPGSVVQYIEAHDNLTSFDCIAQATKLDPEISQNYVELHKRARLGLAFVLTSQGTAFIHAGQEYGRTKQWLADGVPEQKYHELSDKNGNPFKHPYFIHDSYDSSDAVNKFDWLRALNAEKSPVSVATVEYAKGLIALRKSTDAFRLGSIEAVDENVKLLDIPEIKKEDLAIAYSCHSVENDETYYVFANCDSKQRKFTLSEDLTGAEVLVDAEKSGVKAIENPKGVALKSDSITLEPLTVVIIKK